MLKIQELQSGSERGVSSALQVPHMAEDLIPTSAAREREYVESEWRRHYHSLPSPWWLLAILVLISGSAWWIAFDDVKVQSADLKPVSALAITNLTLLSLAALLLRRLSNRVEARNRVARQRAIAQAKRDFVRLRNDCAKMVGHAQSSLLAFVDIVAQRRYFEYLEVLEPILRELDSIQEVVIRLVSETPDVIIEMRRQLSTLITEIKTAESAVSVYEPDLLDRLVEMEARATANNVVDCYQLSRIISPMLLRLQKQNTPFNFTNTAHRLRTRWLICKDTILNDPEQAELWLAIQKNEEELAERHRHNKIMEERAMEQTVEMQKQKMPCARSLAQPRSPPLLPRSLLDTRGKAPTR